MPHQKMKKSFVYRTLQIALAVTLYSTASVWASTNHEHVVSNAITSLNSLLVILAIAVALPLFCFKVLSKLYTPPVSRNLDDTSTAIDSDLRQEEGAAIAFDRDTETMQYRGTRYERKDLSIKSSNNQNVSKSVPKDSASQPVIKYRGASIDDSVNSQYSSSQEAKDAFSTERQSQKSAKPKEKRKYRGSYID
jgi:hypothetical protein